MNSPIESGTCRWLARTLWKNSCWCLPIRSTLDSRLRGNDDRPIRFSVAYLLPSLKTSKVCRARPPSNLH